MGPFTCLFLSLILQRDLGQTGKTVYRISVCLSVIFFFFFSLEYIPLTSNAVAVASVSQFSVLTEKFFKYIYRWTHISPVCSSRHPHVQHCAVVKLE